MRTVSVHVMWDAQEKFSSRPGSIFGMPRAARGASYGGETLVSPGQREHGCRGTQAPSPPLCWHFHRPHPVLCSQVRDLAMETREIPTNAYSAAILALAD